jgi:repressor LexA
VKNAHLTEKQSDILDFIRRFIAENDYPPSYREIAGHFGVNLMAIQRHVEALKAKGYLKSTPNIARSLEPVQKPDELHVYGRVAAGVPLFAVENILGTVSGFKKPYDAFALRVQGDSMIDAGILDGDTVIVRKQNTADDGDIVVAMLNDKATLKRFRKNGADVYLEPANRNYRPIQGVPFDVVGKVVELRRNF